MIRSSRPSTSRAPLRVHLVESRLQVGAMPPTASLPAKNCFGGDAMPASFTSACPSLLGIAGLRAVVGTISTALTAGAS